jgi:hypothetical protein
VEEDLVIYKDLFSQRTFGISKLFQKKNYFDVCSKQTFEKFQRFSWIGLHECWNFFFLLLVKWSDVWLVKRVQASIWGFQRISFQSIHFVCMNKALFHLGKQSLPIQIACIWSKRAWLSM